MSISRHSAGHSSTVGEGVGDGVRDGVGFGVSDRVGVFVGEGDGLGVRDSTGASVEGADVGGAPVSPSVTGEEIAEGAGDLGPVGEAVGEAEGDDEGRDVGGVEKGTNDETDVVVAVGECVCIYVSFNVWGLNKGGGEGERVNGTDVGTGVGPAVGTTSTGVFDSIIGGSD